jgi:hypothetical protein
MTVAGIFMGAGLISHTDEICIWTCELDRPSRGILERILLLVNFQILKKNRQEERK